MQHLSALFVCAHFDATFVCSLCVHILMQHLSALCVRAGHGRRWPAPAVGWDNNATCGVGDVVLVDGAKRDRVIWPGDMGVRASR